jgi:hypothetical protein
MSEAPADNLPPCRYPQSHSTARDIRTELESVAAHKSACTSCYLDTVEEMSNDFLSGESDDHHQGLARTHKLSDGSIYFFLAHSELDGRGSLSQYRYRGPTDRDHILDTDPLTVAPMEQLLYLDERHPSDICFLPDVDDIDAGYLFVAEEFDNQYVTVYRWAPSQGLDVQGRIAQGFPVDGPNFLFIDRVGRRYYLGIASFHWGWGALLSATETDLFPKCAKGAMDVSALRPAAHQSMFPFPIPGGTTQCKLIRDATGRWYLFGFHGDPEDDPRGTDYVDVYGVTFEPFSISYRLFSVHVSFKPGNTGFASTGTHHVDRLGRLLLASSYRWSQDEGPGDSSYVTRVDECPSSVTERLGATG